MKLTLNFESIENIICLSKRNYYDVDHPPLRVQLHLLWRTVIVLLGAYYSTIQPPAPPSGLVWLRLCEPAIRVLAAALLIHLAVILAGAISPAYVKGGVYV